MLNVPFFEQQAAFVRVLEQLYVSMSWARLLGGIVAQILKGWQYLANTTLQNEMQTQILDKFQGKSSFIQHLAKNLAKRKGEKGRDLGFYFKVISAAFQIYKTINLPVNLDRAKARTDLKDIQGHDFRPSLKPIFPFARLGYLSSLTEDPSCIK